MNFISILTVVFATLASALHFFIFYMESFAWETKARDIFGTSEKEAAETKEMAFNQGFYNLFLGIIALVGVIFVLVGQTAVGYALILAGTGSMLAAATVLGITSPDKRSAALRQGAFPLVAVISAVIALMS